MHDNDSTHSVEAVTGGRDAYAAMVDAGRASGFAPAAEVLDVLGLELGELLRMFEAGDVPAVLVTPWPSVSDDGVPTSGAWLVRPADVVRAPRRPALRAVADAEAGL